MKMTILACSFSFLVKGLVLALLMAWPGSALAAVTLTFYAHAGGQVRDGLVYFPHAYVRLKGHLDSTGEVVDEAYGFTAANPGPWLLLAKGRGVLAEPDARYRDEGSAYLSVVLLNAQLASVRAEIQSWDDVRAVYDLRRRNCITFVAAVARGAGLLTPSEDTLSPNGFLQAMAALNPATTAMPSSAMSTMPVD